MRRGRSLVRVRMIGGSRPGLTLIELLVVFAVVGVLVSLLLPALQSAREAARRRSCGENLHQIGLALQNYHAAQRTFPIGCRDNMGLQIAWSVPVLPLLEEVDVWRQFEPDQAYDSAANLDAGKTVVPVYLCPSTSRAPHRTGLTSGDVNQNGRWDPGDDLAWTDYGGMFGVGDPTWEFMNGVMLYDRAISAAEITDGLTRTMIVGEDSGRGSQLNGQWINGQNIFDQTGRINRTRNNELFSDHPGGVQAAFCDGSVRFLSEHLDVSTLFALCTRSLGDRSRGDVAQK